MNKDHDSEVRPLMNKLPTRMAVHLQAWGVLYSSTEAICEVLHPSKSHVQIPPELSNPPETVVEAQECVRPRVESAQKEFRLPRRSSVAGRTERG